MIYKSNKEVCGPCDKLINIGQPILECELCNVAVHTKCYKKAHYSCKNGLWVCVECATDIEPRYNLFFTNSFNDHSDKFYDDDGAGDDNLLATASSVLRGCKSYTSSEFNTAISDLKESTLHKGTSNKHTHTLSSLFLNLDGNSTNFDLFLVELQRFNHEFSIIGLAETNSSPELKDLYCISKYTSYYQTIQEDKHKGTGVAIYVHDSLNIDVLENVNYSNPDIECIFVKITNASKPLIYGVVYRPPNGDIDKFAETFDKISNALPKEGVHIMGDFNADLLDIKSNKASTLENTILNNCFFPTISTATHRRPNCKATCIDNILTNDIENTSLSGTIDDRIGDHIPIFELTNVTTANESKKEKSIKYYEFSNANLKTFISSLESKVDEIVPSTKFSEFTGLFGSLLDTACKLEKPKETKRTQKNNPWITEGIITAVNRKHELRKEWVKTITKQDPKGNLLLHQSFSEYRRLLKHIIKEAKKYYYCEKIYENTENKKKTWQIINQLRGKNRKEMKPSFVIDNKKITNRRVIANEFNKYFNSIAAKLNQSITDQHLEESRLPTFEDYLMPTNQNSMFLEDCTSEEIQLIISEFDNNKASDIPVHVIKKSGHVTSPILAKYFNILMTEGIFPEVLKIGKVTPIYKKDSPEEIGNYRPVSILPIFGKIFEKVMYNRIYSFATSQKLLNQNQFGFRKGHSTSHAINHSVSVINNSIKNLKHTLGIFIDLSKAFDTIDHKTLLTKLDRYGIRGSANNLIKSYLTNRTQYTEALGEKSDQLVIQFGVPQGSVLGPLLFIMYINDITNCSSLGTFIMFADDTNIFVEGNTAEEAYNKANTLLKSLHKYMVLNKLHINLSKCCYIHFKPRKCKKAPENPTLELLIDDFSIKKTNETKFLGVIIDKDLTWEPHILSLKRKLNYATATLNRISNCLPKQINRELYYTLFESHLSYCISVWGGATQGRISKLWTAQKYCIRILFGDKEAYLDKFRTCARVRPLESQKLDEKFFVLEHTKPLFKNQKILSVHNIYYYHTFMETLKILKLRSPISIHSSYNISNRKPTMLIVPPDSSNTFTNRSTSIWNTVAPKLKVHDFSISISSIRGKIKSLLLSLQHRENQYDWTKEDYNIEKLIDPGKL